MEGDNEKEAILQGMAKTFVNYLGPDQLVALAANGAIVICCTSSFGAELLEGTVNFLQALAAGKLEAPQPPEAFNAFTDFKLN